MVPIIVPTNIGTDHFIRALALLSTIHDLVWWQALFAARPPVRTVLLLHHSVAGATLTGPVPLHSERTRSNICKLTLCSTSLHCCHVTSLRVSQKPGYPTAWAVAGGIRSLAAGCRRLLHCCDFGPVGVDWKDGSLPGIRPVAVSEPWMVVVRLYLLGTPRGCTAMHLYFFVAVLHVQSRVKEIENVVIIPNQEAVPNWLRR